MLQTVGERLDARGERKLQMFLETGHPDADEPKGPWPVAERPVEKGARELPDPLGLVGTDGERVRARPNREIGVPHLRRHGPRHLAPRPQVLGELP